MMVHFKFTVMCQHFGKGGEGGDFVRTIWQAMRRHGHREGAVQELCQNR